MLDFEGLVEEIKQTRSQSYKLTDVTKILRGKRISKDLIKENGKYPVVSGGKNFLGHTNESFLFTKDKITISRVGTAGFVNYIDQPFYATDLCFILDTNQNIVLPKFLYYFLVFRQDDINKLKTNSTLPSITIDKLKELKIKIPHLEIQKKIVHFLDVFTALITALKTKEKKRKEKKRTIY